MAIHTAELQSKITNIYNHLYANATTRTPHGIANEVGKILHTAMFIEEQKMATQPAFSFTAKQLKENLNGFSEIFAQSLRKQFVQMNQRQFHCREPRRPWPCFDTRPSLLEETALVNRRQVKYQRRKCSLRPQMMKSNFEPEHLLVSSRGQGQGGLQICDQCCRF